MHALAAWLLAASPAAAQGGAIDPKRVDEAIRRGLEFLKTAPVPEVRIAGGRYKGDAEELVLLTMTVGGTPETDPRFQETLRRMLEAPLEHTYNVSLQAMVLEELDRARFQGRIWQCAQFLVDNQCQNGQWSYGERTPVDDAPTPKATATRSSSGALHRKGVVEFGSRPKPAVTQRIPVQKRRDGPKQGDNSNSQYAALGLRACHEAGILLPKELVQRALDWWVKDQHPSPEVKGGKVATGVSPGDPRGWCYRGHHLGLRPCNPDTAYGSMTAGAIGALAICHFILGSDGSKDKAVRDGLAWLGQKFSVVENPGPPELAHRDPHGFHYYYLYALERAGILLGVEKIGGRDWYAEGAKLLLDAQKEDGSWAQSAGGGMNPTSDTCFAILFLKRATRPLIDVASVDRLAPKQNR